MNIQKSSETKHCWQTEGVYGNASCDLLKTIAHCRRCPEYSKSGRNLLDREIPESFIKEWLEGLSIPQNETLAESQSYLVFRLRNEWLALRTIFFEEALEKRTIHSIPFKSNKLLLGLANINGELILCVDPAEMLDLTKSDKETDAYMMVVSNGKDRYVFPVDEIKGIFPIMPESIKKPPTTISRAGISFTMGICIIDESEIGIIEAEKMFIALERSFNY